MMQPRIALAFLLIAAAAAAHAQIYRWTDEKGRVHVTDTPPPPSAKGVKKRDVAGDPAENAAQTPSQTPYELAQAIKEFPVVLYSSPICKEPCALARGYLNKRGVPFREVQVWESEGNEELKRLTGSNEVPALLVGRSVHKGYDENAYNALLDSARYPRAGILPALNQAAPKNPEGYVAPGERGARKTEPSAPETEAAPTGPYAPGAPKQPRPPQKAPPKQ